MTTPEGLTDESQTLWRSLVPRRISTAGRLAILENALRQRELALRAQAEIERDGSTYRSQGGLIKANPAVRVQADAERAFRLGFCALGLDYAPGGASREDSGPYDIEESDDDG